jgi:hypothetical protein
VVVLVGWAWGVLEMNVVESERMTQNRVIALFRDEENAGDLEEMSGKSSGKSSGKLRGKLRGKSSNL